MTIFKYYITTNGDSICRGFNDKKSADEFFNKKVKENVDRYCKSGDEERGLFFYSLEEMEKICINNEVDINTIDVCDGEYGIIDVNKNREIKIMPLRTIRVNFENGASLITDINGTNEQIESHYLDKYFDLGNNPEEGVEVMVKAVSVEFL